MLPSNSFRSLIIICVGGLPFVVRGGGDSDRARSGGVLAVFSIFRQLIIEISSVMLSMTVYCFVSYPPPPPGALLPVLFCL